MSIRQLIRPCSVQILYIILYQHTSRIDYPYLAFCLHFPTFPCTGALPGKFDLSNNPREGSGPMTADPGPTPTVQGKLRNMVSIKRLCSLTFFFFLSDIKDKFDLPGSSNKPLASFSLFFFSEEAWVWP